MDAKDIEIVKAIIEAAIKAAFQAQDTGIPIAWVSAICGTLLSTIGVLWAWGFKQSNAWAAKIEELSLGQRNRDDAQEKKIRERFEEVIQTLNSDHRDALALKDKRIERLEAAKDFALNQYNNYRVETEGWTRGQIVEVTQQLDESGKTCELLLDYLEKLSRER